MLATRRGPEDPQRARLRSKTEALRKEWSELPPEQAARQHLERLRQDYEGASSAMRSGNRLPAQLRRLEDEVVAQHDILDPARPIDPDPLFRGRRAPPSFVGPDRLETARRAERRKDVEAAERERLSKPRAERDTMRDAGRSGIELAIEGRALPEGEAWARYLW